MHPGHVGLELLLRLGLDEVFRKCFQVNLSHLFIFTVEFVEFFRWIRLVLSTRRVVSELVSFAVKLIGNFLTLLTVAELAVLTLVYFLWLSVVRNERYHLIQFAAELAVETLALLEELPIKLHFDLLHLRGDHVRRHIDQMLLNLGHFLLAKARFVRLVIHFEEFYLFKLVLSLPSDRLTLLLRLVGHLVVKLRGLLVEGVICPRIVQINGLVVD